MNKDHSSILEAFESAKSFIGRPEGLHRLRHESFCFGEAVSVAQNRRSDKSDLSEKIITNSARYKIKFPIGSGANGVVFAAQDIKLQREVAIKVFENKHAGQRALRRFVREAKLAAQLDHPNIVKVYDAGQESPVYWIIYQYVNGCNLRETMKISDLNVDHCIKVVLTVAKSLSYAHSLGIIHRDVKPDNIIISSDGIPILTDFGLSRKFGDHSSLTLEGETLGTYHYMSPEAYCGRLELIDHRSDIFSTGILLYELLCGRRPTDLVQSKEFYRLAKKFHPIPPHLLNKSVSKELSAICLKTIQANVSDRYQNADELIIDLQNELLRRQSKSYLTKWINFNRKFI